MMKRELVAAGVGQRAERGAEPQPRFALARLLRGDRGGELRAHVDARERGRDDAEVRQRRVAAADVGVVDEGAAEAVLGGDVAHVRAGIGDRDEVRAVGLQAVEVLEERVGLDRPAGLAGDDEQRLVEVELLLDRAHLQRLGRVEDVQAQAVGVRERLAEDLGREAGPAHAEHDRVRHARVADVGDEGVDLVQARLRRLGDPQPAEPVGDLRRPLLGPQRDVVLPDAVEDALGARLLDRARDEALLLRRQPCLDPHRSHPARGLGDASRR